MTIDGHRLSETLAGTRKSVKKAPLDWEGLVADRSVIVVGAGASVDFGLPTGRQVLTSLQEYQLERRVPEDDPSYEGTLENFNLFMAQTDRHIHNSYAEFHAAISDTYVRSIDEFTADRGEFVQLAKMWAVRCLLLKMAQAERECVKPRMNFGSEQIPNWLAGVCRRYRSTAESVDKLDPAALKIVTLNYDPLIEIGISRMLASTKVDKIPEVIHVHGSLKQGHISEDDLPSQWRKLRFIQETMQMRESLPEVEQSRKAIEAADTVYSIGFAWNRDNVELLGLDRRAPRAVVLDYDGTLKARLLELGVPRGQIVTGLTAGQAVEKDFLDRRA